MTRFPKDLGRRLDSVPVGPGEADQVGFEPAVAGIEPLCLALGPLVLELWADPPARAQVGRDFAAWVRPGPAAAGAAAARLGLRTVEELPFPVPIIFAATEVRAGVLFAKFRGLGLRIDPASGTASALVERRTLHQDVPNAVRLLLAAIGPRRGALLVQATAVDRAGRMVVAHGPPHAGKSTVARLAGPRRVLSDAAVLCWPEAGVARAAAIGLWGGVGSEGFAREADAASRPVAAWLALGRAEANRLAPVPPARAALDLALSAAAFAGDREGAGLGLDLAARLAAAAPSFRLEFSHRDGSFWELVDRAISTCPEG